LLLLLFCRSIRERLYGSIHPLVALSVMAIGSVYYITGFVLFCFVLFYIFIFFFYFLFNYLGRLDDAIESYQRSADVLEVFKGENGFILLL
jgi:hypothetical protein